MDFKLINQLAGVNQLKQIQPQRVVSKPAETHDRPNLQIRDPQRFKQAQQSARQVLGGGGSTGDAASQLQQLGQLTAGQPAGSTAIETSGGLRGLKKIGSALLGKIEQANPLTQSLGQLSQLDPLTQSQSGEKFSIPLEKLMPGLQGTLELDLNGMAKKISDDVMQSLGLNHLAENLLKVAQQQSGNGTLQLDLQQFDPRLKGTAEINLDTLVNKSQNQPFAAPPASAPVIQRVRNLSGPSPVQQPPQIQPLRSTAPPPATPAARPLVSARPTINISDQQAEKAGEAFRNKLQERFKKAPPNSPVGQYHSASKLLNEYALYKQTGQGPLASDPQARELVEANLKFLQDKVKTLSADPSVKATFKAAREDALKATFGPQHATVAKHYANHLLSDDFAESLKKLPPAQQKEALLKATLKLSALDPQLADQTIKALIVKQMEGELVQNLNAEGPAGDRARAALKATIQDTLAKELSGTHDSAEKIAKATEQMMEAFKKNPKLLLSKDGFMQVLKESVQVFKKGVQPAARTAQAADMQNKLQGMNAANVAGSVLATAALLNGAYMLAKAENPEQLLKGLGNVSSGAAGLENLGKALNLGADSAMMSKLAKAKALGPLGDALGVAADIAGAISEGKNEDRIGQALKMISAVTGTAGTLAGVAVLAGASGPLAPLVVGGAAVVGIGLSVADYFFAESDKTGEVRQALRNTGLSAQQDKVKTQYDKAAGYLYDDPQQMLKDFRKLDNPADKVRYINQLLDNKDVWISQGRADVARQMLESLSGAEVESLIQNGLHTGMLGRKLGFSADASSGIARKLMAVDTPTGKQALQQFLGGLNAGQHSSTLQKMLANPELGEKMLGKLSTDAIKDLVRSAPDGKTAVKILEHSTWAQFNQIIQADDGRAFLNELKTKLVNTPDSHLIGELASWGWESGADPETRKKLESWFSDALSDMAQPQNYAPAMKAFVSGLNQDALQNLGTQLKRSLAASQATMPGYYQDAAMQQQLKSAGII